MSQSCRAYIGKFWTLFDLMNGTYGGFFLVQQPKRRIPRANATPIDINKTRQWNNGNIEVIQADTAPQLARIPDKLNMDEVLINGRRYRVPERIITLDFWDKIARNRRGESASEMWGVVSCALNPY